MFELARFKSSRPAFPEGTKIAGIPVGGMDEIEAAELLMVVYTQPVNILYLQEIILLDPIAIGFNLDINTMLSNARAYFQQESAWVAFRNFLWDETIAPGEFPLLASLDDSLLYKYLHDEVAMRYDRSAQSPMPQAGTVYFTPGTQGCALDIEQAAGLVRQALQSPTNRVVELPIRMVRLGYTSFQNLEIFLKQTITRSKYDGLTALYLSDLKTGQTLYFAYQLGKNISLKQDIAFSATNLVHIPIMIAIFRILRDKPGMGLYQQLIEMIVNSNNQQADRLLREVIHPWRAPLEVTTTMRLLGLQNSFLAGHFSPGSALQALISTPANQRVDLTTYPDIYNQTTAAEIGMLLEDIYHCSVSGGGTLQAVFPEAISQEDCRMMVDLLSRRKIGNLIEAGLPEGARLARKYGWEMIDGVMTTLADAAIVYTPGGDYVLVVMMYHPVQIIWEPASGLVEDLSAVVYNYFNVGEQ